ncbi:polysaccharide export protein [Halomonas ventosae]|uniref:Polysaccharide export outer membrane protein n=1 Tax=Halomonas ventosae TaxID=229007 RepID=A0A2T0VAZ4_9GAMM|nr:polysaccharide export protein [Halomonas ventosae]PRY67370.1 polysaccharide export outer membrane protein [Halomonas ventosae]
MIMHSVEVEDEATRRAGNRPAWRTGSLLALLAALLLLGGCAMAPGGHMDEDRIGESLDERVDLEPITPQLVAAMAPVREPQSRPVSTELRRAVESYEYRLGPGDVLSIIVYDHPELTIPAGSEREAAETGNRIRPDGTMFYPYVGRVKVAGMTLEEVRRLITRRLSEVITDPQVEVGVAAFRSQKVYVSGAVENPGTLPITIVPMTILDAVSQVGGANPNADWHNILLVRDGREQRLSLYGLLRQGDLSQNQLLRDGDMLHVPTSENQNVVVLGQVRRPGAIALGNERITLTDALARAGGVNELRAEPSGIFVVRGHDPDSEKLATVYQLDISDATRLMLGTRFPLQPQDVVYVTSAPLARWNSVISLLLPTLTFPGDIARSADNVGQL